MDTVEDRGLFGCSAAMAVHETILEIAALLSVETQFWKETLPMITEKRGCEADLQNQVSLRSTGIEADSTKGILLGASEFERLLECAAEVLSLRERMAPKAEF